MASIKRNFQHLDIHTPGLHTILTMLNPKTT